MQRHIHYPQLNIRCRTEHKFIKELSQGAYKRVFAVKHRRYGEGCTIKKITGVGIKRTLTIDVRGQVCFRARFPIPRSPYTLLTTDCCITSAATRTLEPFLTRPTTPMSHRKRQYI